MASELRVRCFLPELGLGRDRLNITGQHEDVTRSLSDLVHVLQDVSGDYTVKVMIHRKREGQEEP